MFFDKSRGQVQKMLIEVSEKGSVEKKLTSISSRALSKTK